jgi:hypothetical protein
VVEIEEQRHSLQLRCQAMDSYRLTDGEVLVAQVQGRPYGVTEARSRGGVPCNAQLGCAFDAAAMFFMSVHGCALPKASGSAY